MVCSHLPEGVAPKHALTANNGVHQRVLERVAHVKRTRYIGGGCDGKAGPSPDGQVALIFPGLVPFLLDLAGVVLVHRWLCGLKAASILEEH